MPIRTTEAAVLGQIVDRLREAVPALAGRACRLTDDDGPPRTVPATPFCTVHPGGGTFTDGIAGGGADVLAEQIVFATALWTRPGAEAGEAAAEALLAGDGAGLVTLKRDVLAALLVGWEPRRGNSRLLRSVLRPVRTLAPRRFEHPVRGGLIRLSVEWTAGLAWDVSP